MTSVAQCDCEFHQYSDGNAVNLRRPSNAQLLRDASSKSSSLGVPDDHAAPCRLGATPAECGGQSSACLASLWLGNPLGPCGAPSLGAQQHHRRHGWWEMPWHGRGHDRGHDHTGGNCSGMTGGMTILVVPYGLYHARTRAGHVPASPATQPPSALQALSSRRAMPWSATRSPPATATSSSTSGACRPMHACRPLNVRER